MRFAVYMRVATKEQLLSYKDEKPAIVKPPIRRAVGKSSEKVIFIAKPNNTES